MNSTYKVFAAAFALAAVSVTSGSAKCGPQTPAGVAALARMQPMAIKLRPNRLAAADAAPAAEPSITGLWSTQVLAGGQVVDAGFEMWLSDGTEILNDLVAPSSGAVCLGAWTKTAPFTYTLKHPTYIFDTANVNLVGIGIIRETITLDASGNSFSGAATFDVYDLLGNSLDHEDSQVVGIRITVADDPRQTTGIPGLPVFSKN